MSLIALSLRHHSDPSNLTLQHHPRIASRHSRRRLLAVSSSTLVSERLTGDILSHGYFSAEVTVGTPPQRFSLIVDTGSSITAVPCSECGTRCGEHANPRFRPSSSHTFAPVGCEQREYGCTSCHDRACAYHVAYQEGSSYSGYLATDVVRLGAGGPGACAALRFAFGCATAESGHFRSQQADGIMGLASSRQTLFPQPAAAGGGGLMTRGGSGGSRLWGGGGARRTAACHSPECATTDDNGPPSEQQQQAPPAVGYSPTMLEALVSRGVVADGFSLCIGWEGGTLSFGLPSAGHVTPPPPRRRVSSSAAASAASAPPTPSPPLWTRVEDGAYYAVGVRGVRYGDHLLGEPPSSTIIDSGTTFMYMHSSSFRPLLASLRSVTSCGGRLRHAAAPHDEFCVHVNSHDGGAAAAAPNDNKLASTDAHDVLDTCFEPLRVVLAGGGELSMQPSQFFYGGEGQHEWCAGVFDNYEEGLVLGTINLMDRLVTFDRSKRMVGFVETDCSAYNPHAAGTGSAADEDDAAARGHHRAARRKLRAAASEVAGGDEAIGVDACALLPQLPSFRPSNRDASTEEGGGSSGGRFVDWLDRLWPSSFWEHSPQQSPTSYPPPPSPLVQLLVVLCVAATVAALLLVFRAAADRISNARRRATYRHHCHSSSHRHHTQRHGPSSSSGSSCSAAAHRRAAFFSPPTESGTAAQQVAAQAASGEKRHGRLAEVPATLLFELDELDEEDAGSTTSDVCLLTEAEREESVCGHARA